jgi:hypothetical protein
VGRRRASWQIRSIYRFDSASERIQDQERHILKIERKKIRDHERDGWIAENHREINATEKSSKKLQALFPAPC